MVNTDANMGWMLLPSSHAVDTMEGEKLPLLLVVGPCCGVPQIVSQTGASRSEGSSSRVGVPSLVSS